MGTEGNRQELVLEDYQVTGKEFLKQGNRMLADHMGLGKTIQSLAAAQEILADSPDYWKVLVITLSSLKIQWRREVRKYFTDDVAIMGAKDEIPDAKFVITNPEALFHRKAYRHEGKLRYVTEERKIPKHHIVILDESHFYKNYNSKRTKKVREVTRRAEYVWLLTGTPTPNKPIEIYSQLNLMDKSISSKWQLIEDYMVTWHNGFGIDVGGVLPHRLSHWKEFLSQYMLRRTRELLDLPPLTEEYIYVGMNRQQEKSYKQMLYEMITTIDEEDYLMASNVLAQLTRLRQIALDYKLIGKKHSSGKTDWLLENLPKYTQDHKVLIFSAFSKYVDLLHDKLDGAVKLTGGMSTTDRQEAVDRFTNEPDTRSLIGTIGAMGTGLNLTAASVVIFTDLPWTPDQVEQCYSRAYRRGQDDSVHIVKLVTEDSIEEHVINLLSRKEKIISEAMVTEEVIRRVTNQCNS